MLMFHLILVFSIGDMIGDKLIMCHRTKLIQCSHTRLYGKALARSMGGLSYAYHQGGKAMRMRLPWPGKRR